MSAVRVLIVDDSVSQRFVIKSILTNCETFDIVGEAADGHEAVLQFESLTPDIVILDLIMPVSDGKTALKDILKRDKSAKVIVASSLGGQEDIEECLRMGAIAFVQKPYDEEDLIRAIQDAC